MEMNALLWFLWLCSVPGPTLGTDKQFWFEPTPRTWEEARDVCRTYGSAVNEWGKSCANGDLATVETSYEMAAFGRMDLSGYHAWIGLKEVNSSWRWQNGYRFQHEFAEGQPESGHACGKIVYSQIQAYADNCERKHFFHCQSPTHHPTITFVSEAKPWAEAKEHCRGQSRQLVDISRISLIWNWYGAVWAWRDFPVWIGLHDNGNAWGWSDGAQYQHQRWARGAGPGSRPGSCATVYSSPKYYRSVRNCSNAFPFVCQRDKGAVLKRELLSWEEGLEVCTNISSSYGSFSLVSVHENNIGHVLSRTTGATSKVWVGLRFLVGSWFWSDGAPLSNGAPPSLLPFPLNRCPDPGLHCGALVLNTSSIEPSDCSQKLNVLCYGAA